MKTKTILLSVLLIVFAIVPLPAAKADSGTDIPEKRDENVLSAPPKIHGTCKKSFANPSNGGSATVVALSGGGCKAVAQIGVLRSLERNHIKIDGIVGTSMGAVIGALYCSGYSLDAIETMFTDGEIQKKMGGHIVLKTAARPLSYLSHLVGKRSYGGLTSAKKFQRLLEERLPPDFEKLRIPFAAVATDLTDGRSTVLATGALPKAVFASLAVPPLIRPVEIDGKLFVDGGLKANLPVQIAREMGATTVIAVLVDTSIKPMSNDQLRSIRSVVTRVTDIMLAASDKQQAKSSDILIYPNADQVPMLSRDAELLKAAIKDGEARADKLIPRIHREIAENNSPRSPNSTGVLQ
jgi:NTE family protein